MKNSITFLFALVCLCFIGTEMKAQALPCSASFTFQVTSASNFVQFNNTSTSNNTTGLSASWDFGDNHGSTDFNPAHQYSNSGTYSVCLFIRVTTPNGVICSDTTCQTIVVGQTQLCIDQSLIDPNVVCATLYNPVCGCDRITYSNDCEAKYRHGVTTWTQGACGGTNNCQASFSSLPGQTGLDIQFNNTTFSNGSGFLSTSYWDFGDGITSADFSPYHSYSRTGTYYVCLTTTYQPSPMGPVCTSTTCDSVHVGNNLPGCQASFAFQIDPNTFTVYFSNSSTGSNTPNFGATWDFGDNTTSADINPHHTYSSAGTYHVCLTITTSTLGGAVCNDTYCTDVTVGSTWPGCHASFTFTIDSSGLGVQFTDNSIVYTNTLATHWDFGDGASSTDFNPFHDYQVPGTYNVCLILFAPVSGLGCVDTFCHTVTVGQTNVCVDSSLIRQCPCSANYAPVCGCNGVTYTNDCFAQCDGVLHWAQGACSNQGCQASFIFQLNSNSLTVQFTNTSAASNPPNFSSSWDFGDNTISSDNNPSHTYQSAGTYRVCLIITTSTAAGIACSDTTCSSVTIGTTPPCIDSTLINPNCICYLLYAPVCGCDGVTYDNDCFARCHGVTSFTQGACNTQGCRASFTFMHTSSAMGVQFNNTSSGNAGSTPFTSDWDFGDGTTSADISPLHVYNAAGTYYACLKISVITPNGWICTDTYCDSVRVGQNLPCVDPSVIDTSVVCLAMGIPGVYCGCDGNTYDSPCEAYYHHGVTSGIWSMNGICGSQGCQAGFTFQPDPNTLSGQFNNTSTPNPVPGASFSSRWDFGDGTNSTDNNPYHTFPATGTFYVCLTITTANSNGSACTSTFCDSVNVGYHTPCIDPTLIDPNLACIMIYDPVCGCDGVTYSNKCEAVYHHGVTAWTPGACGSSGNCSAKFLWNYGIVAPTIFFSDISTGGSITNWHWDFGDGSTSNQQNPAHNFPHPGTYVVCLTIACATTPTGPVYTDTWCDTIFHASGCVDPTLIDPNYQCPTLYQPVCGCDSVTYANSCIAQHGHGVTAWTAGPCQNTALCRANFSFQIGSNTHPNTVVFTNLSSGPATMWDWDFGDGLTSNDQNPVHSYSQSGRYKVCLTISGNALTCIDTFCDSVYIHGCIDHALINPQAHCPASYNPVCGCDSVTYYNACVAEKRNGVTSWTPGPCHNNCQANFTFAYPGTGNQILFFSRSTGSYARLKWDFGDGTFANNINDPVHLYAITGWYRVCITISNHNGSCQSVFCDSVFANGCFDQALIDPNQACPAIFQPVCGCDGVTYQNACVAQYDHGVTSFTPGACPNFGYCPTAGQDNHRVWISRVGSNLSGDDGGYAHFDLCHRTQLAGKTYILKLNGATISPSANFQAHWRVWWDFNHDFDFNDPGELAWQGFGSLDQFAVYTIPVDACSGCTRMRVTLSDNFQNVCGNYAVGETEDYDITIRSNVLCPLILMPPMAHNNDLKNSEPNELDEEFAMEYSPIAFNLYPNPAQDMVNIQLTLAEESQEVIVRLLDISGKELYNQVIGDAGNSVSLQVETSHFANGIYQVAIQNDKGFRQVQKLVIAR